VGPDHHNYHDDRKNRKQESETRTATNKNINFLPGEEPKQQSFFLGQSSRTKNQSGPQTSSSTTTATMISHELQSIWLSSSSSLPPDPGTTIGMDHGMLAHQSFVEDAGV